MDPISIAQIIQLADRETLGPLVLEGILHCLRHHGRVEIRMRPGFLATDVPTSCELAITTLKEAGASVDVSAPQLKILNQVMKDALV